MPIGKNAIKRVSGGASAPAVTEEKPIEVTQPVAPQKSEEPKKAAPKKTAPKKTAPKKSMEVEPELSPVKTAEKVVKKPAIAKKSQGISHICIGDALPYYLL